MGWGEAPLDLLIAGVAILAQLRHALSPEMMHRRSHPLYSIRQWACDGIKQQRLRRVAKIPQRAKILTVSI